MAASRSRTTRLMCTTMFHNLSCESWNTTRVVQPWWVADELAAPERRADLDLLTYVGLVAPALNELVIDRWRSGASRGSRPRTATSSRAAARRADHRRPGRGAGHHPAGCLQAGAGPGAAGVRRAGLRGRGTSGSGRCGSPRGAGSWSRPPVRCAATSSGRAWVRARHPGARSSTPRTCWRCSSTCSTCAGSDRGARRTAGHRSGQPGARAERSTPGCRSPADRRRPGRSRSRRCPRHRHRW